MDKTPWHLTLLLPKVHKQESERERERERVVVVSSYISTRLDDGL